MRAALSHTFALRRSSVSGVVRDSAGLCLLVSALGGGRLIIMGPESWYVYVLPRKTSELGSALPMSNTISDYVHRRIWYFWRFFP